MPYVAAAYAAEHARLFQAGLFGDMVASYCFPLPVEQDGQLVVYPTAARYTQALTQIRATLIAGGMTGLCARVAAEELPRDGRFRIWISLDLIYSDRIDMAAVRFVHYCLRSAAGVRVEMVEVLANPAETTFLSAPQHISA